MRKFSLFILAFFIFFSQNSFVLNAETNDSFKIETIDHLIDFPEKISFLFTGTTKKKIDDIKVNFKTGDRKTLQYGYMDFETNDNKVSGVMDFRINTTNGYIPPGSTITWNIIVYFEDGSQFSSENNEFIMLDTRFDDWDSIEGEYITIYYRYSKSRAKTLLEECEFLIKDMEAIVGKTEDKIALTLYNNYAEMIEAVRSKSKTSDRELITAGQAFDESSVVLVLAGRSDIGTSTHEIMHILVGRATDGSINLPLWLNEGLAEYANRDKTVSYDLYLEWGIGTNQLKPLSQLRTFPGDPKLTLVSYGQSRSVVRYMIDNYGQEKMYILLNNLSQGMTIDEALLDSYGFELSTLDSNWRDTIGAGPYKSRENAVIEVKISDPNSCTSNNLLLFLPLLFIFWIKSYGKLL
ncbi:MAG: hypothetical protein GWO78_00450 [Dehalococcoidales bacterium]|nr:hypothetical protein [Dehalococcoidales bacterium]